MAVTSLQGSKRPRTGMIESFGQMGTGTNASTDFGSVENTSAITGVANDQIGSHWDWDDDDDRGMGMDIQALLSEFGDFGDFFENENLPFGEVILFSFSLFSNILSQTIACFLNI